MGQQQDSTGRHRGWRRLTVWGVGLGALALVVVAAIPGGTRAQPSFYATAAQIIPVLIVALVVERLWRGWRLRSRVLIAAVIVLGEVAAMVGSAYDVQKNGHTGYLVGSSRLLTDMLECLAILGIGVGLLAVLWNSFFEPGAVIGRTEASEAGSPHGS